MVTSSTTPTTSKQSEIFSLEEWMQNPPKGTEWVDGKLRQKRLLEWSDEELAKKRITQQQQVLLSTGDVVSTQAVLQGFSVAVEELLA